jgi:predicted ATP-grasp superfamily ATP-dependent carboligase
MRLSVRRAAAGPPCVVATMSYSGLALARSLARRGVRVIGVGSSRDDIGMSSRFLTSMVYPDILRSEQDTVDALLDLSRRIGESAVLFPTGDALVLPLSRHRAELAEHYQFLIPQPDVVECLLSKSGLADTIEERDIPGPRSTVVLDAAALADSEEQLRYPVLIKPVFSASWYRAEMTGIIGHVKVVVAENREQLRRAYQRIASIDPQVVLQEFIPGEDSRLYYVCGYFGADGALEAIFAGQKLRVTPVHFGSASFVTSVRDERLVEATRRLLEPLGYQGLFGVEFKLDPRDGEYKVIEVNVRWGLWDGLARRCGIDLGYLAYARQAGLPYQVDPDYRTGVRWISLNRDIDAFRGYRSEGLLSTWEWIKSLPGETEHATFAWDDPLPGLVEMNAILRPKLRGAWARVRSTARGSPAVG